MIFVKIWVLTVVLNIILIWFTRLYYKSNQRAAFQHLMFGKYPKILYVIGLLAIFNIIGLFYTLIYLLFLR